ncbi:MAG: triose-phosphate isomerase [Fimbriimonadaceae bacterium]|nr:triose-phosphate isomerase [Fimbriimonadaceae bacterium]
MRRPVVAGNWKMNLSRAEAAALVETIKPAVTLDESVEVVLCPPYTALSHVHDELRRSNIQVGAQNVFWERSGAFTGQVSVPMLRDAGCTYCIVGHSEARGSFGILETHEGSLSYFAETDRTVGYKVRALLDFGIIPIVCVGETESERGSGQTEGVIDKQLEGALGTLDEAEMGSVVVAYEPVWAIGTGKTCESEEANRICAFIREKIGEHADAESAEDLRVLYGGSVKPNNARELFAQSDIDGGLVGGASLDGPGFVHIIRAAQGNFLR